MRHLRSVQGAAPLALVVAKSAQLRFHLAAKTAFTPLLLLFPTKQVLWGPLIAILAQIGNKHGSDEPYLFPISFIKTTIEAEHKAELNQFYAANRLLTKYCPDGKYNSKAIQSRYTELEQQHNADYAMFKNLREETQIL